MSAADTSPSTSLAVVTSGRITRDNSAYAMLGNAPTVILPPPDPHGQWRTFELDGQTLSRVNATRLVELMSDTSPEFSRALDDSLRLLNPGWDFRTFKPGTKDEDPRARAIVTTWLRRLRSNYGSVDVPINREYIGLMLRGAWFGELVIGSDRRTAIDLATPDPATVRFQKVIDPERGEIYQVGQWQGTEFVPLDLPTIRYVPHDPFPGSPYGRSPLAPGIFGALFLMGFLNDIRRVIAQQGYPRIHISINLKKLIEVIPQKDRDNWKKIEEYGIALQKRIELEYSKLRPEDAYVHSDVITIDRPVGTLDASSLGMVENVIGVLERMLVRALKSTPFMFGLADGSNETNANRQWELMVQRIKSLQHLCEAPLEDLITFLLQAEGIQCDVEFRFSEVRTAELLRDAQVEWQVIRNEREKYKAGWISQEAAAQAGAGVDEPDQEEPRDDDQATTPQFANTDQSEARVSPYLAGTGVQNFARLTDHQFAQWCDAQRVYSILGEQELSTIATARARYLSDQQQREKLTPKGAGEGFADLPDSVDYAETDRDAVRAAWDSAMPDYAGLLAAEVEGDEEADDEAEESAAD